MGGTSDHHLGGREQTAAAGPAAAGRTAAAPGAGSGPLVCMPCPPAGKCQHTAHEQRCSVGDLRYCVLQEHAHPQTHGTMSSDKFAGQEEGEKHRVSIRSWTRTDGWELSAAGCHAPNNRTCGLSWIHLEMYVKLDLSRISIIGHGHRNGYWEGCDKIRGGCDGAKGLGRKPCCCCSCCCCCGSAAPCSAAKAMRLCRVPRSLISIKPPSGKLSPDNFGRTRTPANFGGDKFGWTGPPENSPAP